MTLLPLVIAQVAHSSPSQMWQHCQIPPKSALEPSDYFEFVLHTCSLFFLALAIAASYAQTAHTTPELHTG